MENRVYLSTGDLRFHDATVQLGLALRNHGMSVLAGDLDDDGRVDLAFSDIGPPLVMRRTENGFVRLGESAGFRRVAQWSWGGAMEDFDADGDLDLLFENQGIELGTLSLYCTADCTFGSVPREELLLYRNDSHARFSAERPAHGDASPFGGEDFAGGTALAHGDVDRDGVLDVVLTRKARQGGPTQAWLLPGSSSVGRGISVEAPQGALVQACTTERCSAREVLGGHGFAAIMARRIFFGIGSASEATVTVSWRGVEHDLGIVHAGELARFGD